MTDLKPVRKLTLVIKEIGIPDLAAYACYQARLRSGWLKYQTPQNEKYSGKELLLEEIPLDNIWVENWKNASFNRQATLPEDETRLLSEGNFHPFFGNILPLDLSLHGASLKHWSVYNNEFLNQDIKFTWEPARFNWSLFLARSHHISPSNQYPRLFWQKVEEFLEHNPVNTGPNWASAQEVAFRAIMWILTAAAFEGSPTPQSHRQVQMLNKSVRSHLTRLLPTLDYARSQRNNHLLSEALGLVIIGDYLSSSDRRASGWVKHGLREFEQAILDQVDHEGNYSQHSANYHRLMLHLALLYDNFLRKKKNGIPQPVRDKLVQATRWLIAQIDTTCGRLPNLGHNDGTLLLPFGCTEYRDYRPTAQAAAIAFLGKPCLPPGPWDELAAWLGLEYQQEPLQIDSIQSPAVHKVGENGFWASLRGVRFNGRPAHADQLHTEIWWHGINLARDPGTYLYNAPPPWQNSLDATRFHNTICVDATDQMQRVSRFLWLAHANATWTKETGKNQVNASHNGYRRLGITHTRILEYLVKSGFLVIDQLDPQSDDQHIHDYRLHWLLPDWNWEQGENKLTLSDEHLQVRLEINASRVLTGENVFHTDLSLIRAGESLTGKLSDELLGWESDTYGEKHPALSLTLRYMAGGPLKIVTKWTLFDGQ